MTDSTFDQQVRRIGTPPTDQVVKQPKPKPKSGFTSWSTSDNEKKGSGGQSAAAGGTDKMVRADGIQQWHGEQQVNAEHRGQCDAFLPMGGAGEKPITGGIASLDLSSYNVFRLTLNGPTQVQFTTDGFDILDGSQRSNMRINRLLYVEVIVVHKGFKVTFPAATLWEGGTPDFSVTPATAPAGGGQAPAPVGRHYIAFEVDRSGISGNAVEVVAGFIKGLDMKPGA